MMIGVAVFGGCIMGSDGVGEGRYEGWLCLGEVGEEGYILYTLAMG